MYNKDNASKEDKKGGRNFRRAKRKLCAFCVDKSLDIDYKDIAKLKKFLSDRAKIIPRRVSGCCAYHQRQLTSAIKCARVVALLPYVNE